MTGITGDQKTNCEHCGAQLRADEMEFYGASCERCETELHAAMQEDRAPILPPPSSEIELLRARAARAEAEVARLKARLELDHATQAANTAEGPTDA